LSAANSDILRGCKTYSLTNVTAFENFGRGIMLIPQYKVKP